VTDTKKILVISLGGAGDTLMATPLLHELRGAFPDAALDVLTMQGAVARDILSGNPNINEHLHYNFMREPFFKSMAYCRMLRRRNYDLSFTVMPQNRWEYNVITRLIGARERVGFCFLISCGSFGRWLLTKLVPEKRVHLVENNLRLITKGLGLSLQKSSHNLELFLTQHHRAQAEAFLGAHALQDEKIRLVGLHPGSGTTKNLILKRWPLEKWGELARLLGRDERVHILLFGGPEEQGLREAIEKDSQLPASRILDAGNLPILEVAALMERLDGFVCNDALLTHVAAAVNIPTVVIQGPLPHWSTRPYACRKYKVVRLDLPCSPCYGYAKYGIRCTNRMRVQCLKEITPQQVAAALKELTDAP